MTNRPDPSWYTLNADTSAPTRLLDDDGHPKPNLSTDAEHALAALTAGLGSGLAPATLRRLTAEKCRLGLRPCPRNSRFAVA